MISKIRNLYNFKIKNLFVLKSPFFKHHTADKNLKFNNNKNRAMSLFFCDYLSSFVLLKFLYIKSPNHQIIRV